MGLKHHVKVTLRTRINMQNNNNKKACGKTILHELITPLITGKLTSIGKSHVCPGSTAI